ncbi:MAG: ABC transporter ATP-binding protein [Promethearchaeota archaeon]|nr:MAG: ABC transporter ATP-binding protein [Candidatus Lokiarchaeota archaeon]
MSGDSPLILTHDVEYTYPNGSVALKKINLSIFKGELVGIMGKNGAGKTTLIRTFNGLIRPTAGNIYINSENIKSKTIGALSQKIGIIFQNPQHQVFSNTIEEEIKFSLKSLNLSKKESQARVDAILKKFDLEKYRERSPLNLSGGETKKLAVASIFCRDPDILIFDEPTLGQDAKEIEFFINLIKHERENGKTIIIVTHNVEFAMEFIPRTILMTDGKIIADGPTSNLLTNQFLVNKTSLILPQINQFIRRLNDIGIKCSPMIFSKQEMIAFLIDYLKNSSNKQKEVGV